MYGELTPIKTKQGDEVPLHLPTAVIDEKTRQRLRANSRRCYEKHKARILEAKRRYRLEHPEVVAEYDRRADARYRERKGSDPEYQERERAKDRAYQSEWRLDPKNRELAAVRFAAWKARRFQAEGSFTVQEWRELLARHDYRCLCCGGHFESGLQPDHVVPLSHGGSNRISNIQPLCGPCNNKKMTKSVDYRLEGQCTES